jgi:hypothetical protein
VVADGEALLSPSIRRRLIADYARRPPASEQPAALAELTPRELEGAVPVRARPLERRDLARAHARRGNREDPRRRVFQKLDLHDRAQAVVLAYETGLVIPGEAA